MPDPIWAPLEPAAPTSPIATQGNPNLGKEEFLTLLIAQLRHQDPLNPSNPEEMASQLAQFSSLEQLVEVNQRLDGQAAANAAMAVALNSTSAVGILGKTVLAVGDQVDVTGAAGETVTVGVDAGGGTATVTLYDEEGEEVGTYEAGFLEGGRQDIDLDSLTDDLPPGRYRYEVDVVDRAGDPVRVQTFSRVRIDGVRYGVDGPILVSGTLEIPLSDVVEILDAPRTDTDVG